MSTECKIKNLAELRLECDRLGLEMPQEEDISVLFEDVDLGGVTLSNRFCVQPMEGADADMDGAPGELTFRRYRRYAKGGFGLIWVEATAVTGEARSNPSQLMLTRGNVDAFKDFISAVREASDVDVKLIIQLAHAGRFTNPEGVLDPVSAVGVTDEYLDEMQGWYLEAARLAAESGFDGVDVKSCHSCLVSELMHLEGREGKYGGSFENRTRFLVETVAKIRAEFPEILVTTRMGVTDIPEKIDEAVKLAKVLKEQGMSLLSVSVENTYICTDVGKGDVDVDEEDEPLTVLARVMDVTGKVQKAVSGVAVVGGSYSWFKHLGPQVAAGMIKSGAGSIAGMGRGALAYPNLVRDVFDRGAMRPADCCITCSSCIQLLRDGGKAGCVIKDSDVYAGEYRYRRHYSAENLKKEAGRCHDCANAPCIEACPARINVPGFIKAFERGDMAGSYGILSESDVLPAVCSELCPVSMMCEGACIETHLSGSAIPIHDIQYAVSSAAMRAGLVGVDLPDSKSGKTIAVVGAGPAGIAASVKLLEKGHEVVIYEREKQLGGTPRMIIGARCSTAGVEAEAILQPALRAGVLQIRYGEELGETITLAKLRDDYDAVLLAMGLWAELSLDEDVDSDAVVDAITFLKKAKNGELVTVPSRVAILSGGDCAMDSAVTAKELGAEELYIVYGGTLSEMHWHMNDSWFRTEGVTFMNLTDPIGYEVGSDGKLKGLRINRVSFGSANPIPGGEDILGIDMVIEAMGLGVEEKLKGELDEIEFSEYDLIKTVDDNLFDTGVEGVFAAGGVINGGASVAQCVAEGMKAAAEIHAML